MISYFYHFQYSIGKSVHTAHAPEGVTHAKVFAAAIKYQVDGLRDLAAENFNTAVKHSLNRYWSWDGRGDYAEVAATRTKAHCETLRAFAEILTVVFESTPDEVTQLRDTVLEVLLDNFESVKSNHAIEEAMCNIPGLGFELLRRKSLRPPPRENRSRFVFTCKICRQVKCEHPLPKTKVCDRCSTTEK